MDIFTNQQPMEKRKGRFRLCAPPSYLLHLLLSDPKLDPGGPEPQGEPWAAKGSPATGTCQGHAKAEGFGKASLGWDAGCRCVWGARMEVRGLLSPPPRSRGRSGREPQARGSLGTWRLSGPVPPFIKPRHRAQGKGGVLKVTKCVAGEGCPA